MNESGVRATDTLGHCGDLVRTADPDRFFSAMTARPAHRAGLFAIYAFNHEIAKIAEVVSEPLLGQIRVQWWRDALDECFAGTPRRHQVVQALASVVQQAGLPRALFDAALDAREGDLDPQAPQSMDALAAYAQATSGSITRLAAVAVGVDQEDDLEAARAVGTAWGLVGLMRAMPFHLRQRRCLLPAEVLSARGLDVRDLIEGRRSSGFASAVRDVCDRAGRELHTARMRRGFIPRGAYGALSLGVLADCYMRQLKRCGYDPFDPRLATPPATRTLSLYLRSWGERF